jgi:sulfide dehydrogenase cytochrome subunit
MPMTLRAGALPLAALLLAPAAAPPALAQAPLAAQGCVGCHGQAGAGSGAVPALAGRDAAELATMLLAFRADQRPGTIMGRITRGYTDAEIDAVAAFFAAARR